MTARATPEQTPVSVTSGSKREASEMRNDTNTVSTPPHPVEEAVALTPERIAELRKIAEGAGAREWKRHKSFPRNIVPAGHETRATGAAVDEAEDRDRYAETLCYVYADRHGRHDPDALAEHIATFNPVFVLTLLSALERQNEALERIGNDAEECSFVAAAIEPNERALVVLGKRFQGIQKRARSALGGQHG